MRVLVLGSSGQIGSALVRHLRNIGHTVVPFDIELDSRHDLRMRPNVDLHALRDQVDYVVFLAFDVGGSKYLSTAQLEYGYIQNNLNIMSTVFDFLSETKLPFVFASSQMAGMLHSSYGNLKAVGEKATVSLGGKFIRFWNVYGIEENPLKSHVVTDFIRQALVNKRIQMLTDGSEIRDFLHVEDACSAIVKVMSLNQSRGYDVASFEYRSILSVAEIISELTGADICKGTSIDNVQAGHRFDPTDEILKFWTPKISMETGISKIYGEMRR